MIVLIIVVLIVIVFVGVNNTRRKPTHRGGGSVKNEPSKDTEKEGAHKLKRK